MRHSATQEAIFWAAPRDLGPQRAPWPERDGLAESKRWAQGWGSYSLLLRRFFVG